MSKWKLTYSIDQWATGEWYLNQATEMGSCDIKIHQKPFLEWINSPSSRFFEIEPYTVIHGIQIKDVLEIVKRGEKKYFIQDANCQNH